MRTLGILERGEGASEIENSNSSVAAKYSPGKEGLEKSESGCYDQ